MTTTETKLLNELANAAIRVTKYKYLMSHNDSCFGEPEGAIKGACDDIDSVICKIILMGLQQGEKGND